MMPFYCMPILSKGVLLCKIVVPGQYSLRRCAIFLHQTATL
jgi:hypothetical protein